MTMSFLAGEQTVKSDDDTHRVPLLTRLADASDIEELWNTDAPNRPRLVVVTIDVWDEITNRLEDAEDAAALAAPRDFDIPNEVVLREIDGATPVQAWREHRGMRFVTDLARATGISAAYLRDIEAGRKPGSVSALKKIAKALDVPMDVLVDDD